MKDYFKKTTFYVLPEDGDHWLRWNNIRTKEHKSMNFWLTQLIKEAVNVKYPKNSTNGQRMLTLPTTETPNKTIIKKLRMMNKDQLIDFEKNSAKLHDLSLDELRKRND